MSRSSETQNRAKVKLAPVSAPPIHWDKIGKAAPTPIDTPGGSGPLPDADVVVVTWTDAEWSAFDHVFVNSGQARSPTQSTTWQESWQTYSHNAQSFASGSSSAGGPLWGKFRMASITDASNAPRRVLLFKANAHLAHAPWIAGLRAMVQNLLADTSATRILSIGTAGAGRTDQKLGDPVVTNAAYLEAVLQQNRGDAANNKQFTSSFVPKVDLATKAQQLMFPLAGAATPADLQSLFKQVFPGGASGAKVSDLIDGPLQELTSPTVHSLPSVPLNTSDDYGMAPVGGSTQYSVYEEDDAVIAQVAVDKKVDYASVRNVSDTVIAGKTASGAAIEQSVRKAWAGALYDRYGFLAAVNGAIAAWATIAGN
jgi:hypothetical protein